MKKGFTLIELLVVVLIIGILAAIALPQYKKAVEKSRMSEGIMFTRSLASGVQLYHMQNGSYPLNYEDMDITLPGTKAVYDGVHDRLNINKNWYSIMHPPSGSVFVYPIFRIGRQPYLSYNNYNTKLTPLFMCISDQDNTEAIALCKSLGAVDLGITYCSKSNMSCMVFQ
ncbi:prepilin-type N-terminal cleavage/methylation domain-containing protein [Elusimicrobium posterum]|uniref:type IV pilin protein n=1 Tax=Elusimicrobium posterum TaxID=3116653 RepID=UPI003C710149